MEAARSPPILPAAETSLGGGEGLSKGKGPGVDPKTTGVAPRPASLPMRGRRTGRTRSPSTVAGRGRYPGPSDPSLWGGVRMPRPPPGALNWVSLVRDNPPQPPRHPRLPSASSPASEGGCGRVGRGAAGPEWVDLAAGLTSRCHLHLLRSWLLGGSMAPTPPTTRPRYGRVVPGGWLDRGCSRAAAVRHAPAGLHRWVLPGRSPAGGGVASQRWLSSSSS